MQQYKIIKGTSETYIETRLSDYTLLNNSLLNKGMGFTESERDIFNLHGLIPPQESTLDIQRARSYAAFSNKISNIEKYRYLRDLQDSNETLFYSLLNEYISEMMPIIYTPTVGAGCQQFSHLYRRPRGIFIAYPNRHRIDEMLANSYFDYVEAIVVSDGERILGLGDQGAGGMGIPIGKLSLYTACAGIHPGSTLPILLDTGTNNPELINDPLYIGWRHERVRGDEYLEFIDMFVTAIKKRFPRVLLQWEDFAQQNANVILERYRDQLCTFNDDIQGTAAVATSTLLSAIQVAGTHLKDQIIVVLGGGSAGCGISNLIIEAMMEEGLSEADALARFFIIDRNGLLVEGMNELLPFQQKFRQPRNLVANWQLEDSSIIKLRDVIRNVHPTALIGVSGQGGAFDEESVREMAKHTKRPIIFPLSNPTSKSEATPTELMTWTEGRVIMGTGSPFEDILKNDKPFRVDQTNNSYIFPGMGLGLVSVQATRVTDKMFMLAAKALAQCSPALKNPEANLLPPLTQIREVSLKVAVAVAQEAIDSGFAAIKPQNSIEKLVRDKMWMPTYLPYKKAK